MTTLTDNATTIEIKGALYAVEPIPAGEFGTAAARVTKLVNGEVYDVLATHDGRCECTCPDFEARHRGLPTQGCKHIKGVKAAGLLVAVEAPVPAPTPVAPKPAFAPITRKDLARAAMFKIKLPADAPMAVEAPVPVVEPVKAEASPDDDASHYGPEGDSWSTWSEDLDTWTITPEVEPAPVADEPDNYPACHSCGSDLYLDLDGFVCWTCEDKAKQTPPAPAEGSIPFDRPELFAPPCPETEWVSTSPTGGVLRRVEPGPRPSRLERFQPTPEMDMERLGYELGRDGEDARAPKGRSFPELVAFYDGWLAGKAELDAEFNAWLDEIEATRDLMADAFGGPAETWHPAELVEARSFVGHMASEG